MTIDARSHGLWQSTAPAAPATAPLDRDIEADVAIIGAGFTGLSAALHLAEGGARVAVLEAAEVGFGGSGRNVGLVNAGLWVMPDDVPAVLGADYGERLLRLLGEAPALVFELIAKHAIACEPERAGTLHCAVGDKGLAEISARAAQWQARGAPVRLLGAAEAAVRIGSTAYAGALLDARAGTIQPLAYVRGLARAAIAAGARIFTRSPVSRAMRDGEAAWRLDAPGGAVRAPWVVVATNAYGMASPFPQVAEELVLLPYFQFATAPLGHNLRATILPGREGAWDTKEILSSFRLDAAGRLLFGSVGALRGTGEAVHRAWARRAVRRIFPQLGDVTFDTGWFGRIGMTSDSTPRFHELAPNIIGFSGYNGRGIAPGTIFGRALARRILGQGSAEEMPLPATAPRAVSFRAVKGAYYEFGAQAAHLADGRLRGRSEPAKRAR
ncbi:MAG TPA: FAD-binding oxidoreductase [Lichenihabitans sp.]|nr:FAD-binding oxidoreductase [Lichenihabitans sp.]